MFYITGDAGINYNSERADLIKKQYLSSLPITILAIHGNHKNRPINIPTYTTKKWNEGIVLSHTAPICFEPIEAFLPRLDQSKVDKSTEMWLGSIECELDYKKWYCGHYHIEKRIDKIEFMFENFDTLKIKSE